MDLRQIRTRALRAIGLSSPYQDKRVVGTQERWQLIKSNLDADDRSLIDLGCSAGFFTARAAQEGLFSIGVDPSLVSINAARRRYKANEDLAFAIGGVTPDKIDRLPRTDVVLCLSVHHVWYRLFGKEESWKMVGKLIDRSQKVFFEPACIHRRYGKDHNPGFKELDEDSTTEFVTSNLQEFTAGKKQVIKLGPTPCLGDEKFRVLYLIK